VLVSAFADGNPVRFHDRSGGGYDFLAEQVLAIDPKNPLLAARLMQPLGQWRRHDAQRQGLMRGALERVLAAPGLSKNSYEIATKSLA
ncbi:MAG: aminopeptidase N C-terminal domain-containing protein, partial [Stellaceae bacterium]